jgi:hypothetical protein
LVFGFEPLPHLRFFTRRSLECLLRTTGFEVKGLRREGGPLLALAKR